MKITRAVVPSLFTVLNMFCGFLSIVQSSEGKFTNACWFIVLAGVFDSLDGFMARLTKSSSQFGVEIDSLSDVVSFGTAPAFLVYKLSLFQLEGFGLIISSLLALLGGIRLARFNIQLVGFDKNYFVGLPIPASAITIISFVLFFYDEKSGAFLYSFAPTILPFLTVIVSLLMVSKVKYDTLPKFSKKEFQQHPIRTISALFAALLIIFTKGNAIFFVCLAFILFGLIKYVYEFFQNHFHHNSKTEDTEEVANYDV